MPKVVKSAPAPSVKKATEVTTPAPQSETSVNTPKEAVVAQKMSSKPVPEAPKIVIKTATVAPTTTPKHLDTPRPIRGAKVAIKVSTSAKPLSIIEELKAMKEKQTTQSIAESHEEDISASQSTVSVQDSQDSQPSSQESQPASQESQSASQDSQPSSQESLSRGPAKTPKRQALGASDEPRTPQMAQGATFLSPPLSARLRSRKTPAK